MVHSTAITVAAAALLAALPVNAGLYTKSSPVLQLDGKSYDRLIAQSNYTSIVEFYAPWCGHCKSLQPAYEKAAKSLAGLAKVAAVDCDEELNKPFCQKFGVQGFPTLKIVKPGKTPGRPIVEDYNGPRNAKGIVDAVIDKIPNHVKKVEDKTLEAWLAEANDTAKAILFTDKGKTSALMKAIAIEFKGSISVAQTRNTDKEKATLELFGITKFPTLLLLPGGKEAQGMVYDGELKKEAIVTFLSQAAAPNPDPAPPKVKLPKSKESKKASKNKQSTEGTATAASATEEDLEEEPTESPQPKVESEKPTVIHDPAPPIPFLASEAELRAECLGPRTGTCILALLPQAPDDVTIKALGALSELAHKYRQHKRTIFPFYVLPLQNQGSAAIRDSLKSIGDTDVIAVNGRRGWWRQISRSDSILAEKDVTEEAIEAFVDAIRLGEGAKQKLPGGLILDEVVEESAPEEAQEPAKTEETPVVAEDAKAEEPKVPEHGEL
ncbi:putative protein disulfide isomerase-related protein A [Venustampulla echinocandica]|uniref:protein disulfide-isomerase n=1 Tax=Venustampulla echinocandica TaxID=2656787 RepID=A0A370TF56_9HELO|nr:putative protein disulfide isomerase-related protein A [Venustampulla echinocandica]RDL33324.1 putative protein disulfide isomerase-related protein A [Venustampulla echinocandica]